MFVFLLLTTKRVVRVSAAVLFAVFALAIYVPAGYYLELWMWRRRQRKKAAEQMIDPRMFTVGPVQENCFIVREKDATPR